MRSTAALAVLSGLIATGQLSMVEADDAHSALLRGAGEDQRRTAGGDSDQLDGILRRAGAYLAGYEKDVPAIVATEDYTQRFIVEPSTEVRHLRSDLLTIRDEAEGWIGFRDVYEIDGRPTRDRTDRLAKLFLEALPDSRSQAIRIAEESARFNLAPQVPRTVNVPLLALQFLRSANQGRSQFTLAGTGNARGAQTVIVSFQERVTPGIIRTVDGAKARGRFWIEADSGQIRETELVVNTAVRPRTVVSALIHVVYAEEPRLHLWLPASMTETYQGFGVIDGRATYSNFRRFNVATTEVVKGP